MIIYSAEGQNMLADYYDSEGHVIHYSGQISKANQVVFTSDSASSGSRFRLSYKLEAYGKLIGKFEITSPAQPDTFMPYLNWAAIKRSDHTP